jgi:uncharacterized protein YbjT (DUF2867 family)
MEIKAIIFGATGHIGQGVLLESLESPHVSSVLAIGRKSCGRKHNKLKEIIHTNFLDYSDMENELTGYNACFYCLGVSSAGMTEEKYHLITYDYTVAAAEILSRQNPEMTFCFISGAGTDDTMKSRMMWARVKGKAENSLEKFPFKNLYLMRPAYIQPVKGVQARLAMYKILGPLFPLWKFLFPNLVTTTEEVGLAMINAVLYGYDKKTLENRDMIRLANKHIPQ